MLSHRRAWLFLAATTATADSSEDFVHGFCSVSLVQVQPELKRGVTQVLKDDSRELSGSPLPRLRSRASTVNGGLQRWWPQQSAGADIHTFRGVLRNAAGDLPRFLAALAYTVVAIALLLVSVNILRRWHPTIFCNAVVLGKVPESYNKFEDKWFGWLAGGFGVTIEEVEEAAGLDCALLIEFTHVCMRLMFAIGLPLLLILCPLHVLAGGGAAHDDRLSRLGMANVEPGSWLHWVHAGFIWYVVVVTVEVIFHAMDGRWVGFWSSIDGALLAVLRVCFPILGPAASEALGTSVSAAKAVAAPAALEALGVRSTTLPSGCFLDRRKKWLKRMPWPRCTTVMVKGIPAEYRSDEALLNYFATVFSQDQVESAYVVRHTEALLAKRAALAHANESLHQALFQWEKDGKVSEARPTFRACCGLGKLVDKISYCEEEVQLARREVDLQMQQCKDRAEGKAHGQAYYTSCGFVTFSTRRSAAVALRLRYRDNLQEFAVSIPPDTGDVIFGTLQGSSEWQAMWKYVGYICIVGLFFGFAPIVAAITSLMDLTELKRSFNVIDTVLSTYPALRSFLEGVISTLGMTICMAFLPSCLALIFHSFFSLTAHAEIQHHLQIWYFWFLLIFLVLLTTLGSSVLGSAKQLLNNPTYIFELLAVSLPSTSHWYMGFVVLQSAVHVLNLTRYQVLFKYLALRVIMEPERARQFSEPEDQDYYGIGSRSARFAIVCCIALLFCTVCPMITAIAFINFFVCRGVYGYLMVFAETRKPDLGGVFYVSQLKELFVGVLLYALLMLGVLSMRATTFGPCAFAAPSLVYLIHAWQSFGTQFEWKRLPFESASAEVIARRCDAGGKGSAATYRQRELEDD